MADPFLGEVKMVAFNFAPKGWAMCNGQLLPINQNQGLFSLFGTMYGGNGQTTFALPDLRGRVPVHVGPGFNQGQAGGEQAHTVTAAEMASHTHAAQGTTSNSDSANAAGNLFGAANNAYAPAGNLTPLQPATITTVGGSQPHANMQPFLTLTFCVALQGIFPSKE